VAVEPLFDPKKALTSTERIRWLNAALGPHALIVLARREACIVSTAIGRPKILLSGTERIAIERGQKGCVGIYTPMLEVGDHRP
jgi:hypothetical protein